MPEDKVVATPQEIPDSDADCIAHIQQVPYWKKTGVRKNLTLRHTIRLVSGITQDR